MNVVDPNVQVGKYLKGRATGSGMKKINRADDALRTLLNVAITPIDTFDWKNVFCLPNLH